MVCKDNPFFKNSGKNTNVFSLEQWDAESFGLWVTGYGFWVEGSKVKVQGRSKISGCGLGSKQCTISNDE
ncbi:hypothetical protein D2V93_17370 [Flagellimonas taeanensis]|jgi:hypothetical protein|nr:hypothetical protein D2V93_17370 [Allomuricauda taeanensis]